MANLETKYLGLTLKNPLVVSSSGLTSTVEKIKQAEENGAAAVVLKSIFEEQINNESANYQSQSGGGTEAFDYLQTYVSANSMQKHINLIQEAKREVDIPIIASVSCFSDKKWINFAQQFEDAGADALEVNIYIMPDDRKVSGADIEKSYYNVIKKLVKKIKIPVSVKLSYHFTNIINVVDKIKGLGVDGVVLFNRFYEPNIDINNMEMTSASVFSTEHDIRFPLRWTAVISDQVKGMDISATTGVHNAEGVIKMILAGADTVQLCSVLYQKGLKEIKNILDEMQDWMNKKGFETIDAFRANMSYKSIEDSSVYERSQFMKYFSNHG